MTVTKMNSVADNVAEVLKEVETSLEFSKPYLDRAWIKMGSIRAEFRRGWTGVADLSIWIDGRYAGGIDLPDEAPVKKLVCLVLQAISMARGAHDIGAKKEENNDLLEG